MSADLLQLVPPWEIEEGGTLLETPIFSLRTRRSRSPARPDKAGTFFYMDTGDWVNVIAVTGAREVVLIEQFRHGLAQVTLEIPGGMVDGGETPLAAGLRELREETGYAPAPGSAAPRIIGVVAPNPAIQNNHCHTAWVQNVDLLHEVELDGHEEIGVRLVPIADIPDLIRRGVIQHALVVAAFHHLLLDGSAAGSAAG